jgi:hypothetical protein
MAEAIVGFDGRRQPNATGRVGKPALLKYA